MVVNDMLFRQVAAKTTSNGQRAMDHRNTATPGALAALRKTGQEPGEFLARHVNREWGDLSDEDQKENDYSLEHGFRLLSS